MSSLMNKNNKKKLQEKENNKESKEKRIPPKCFCPLGFTRKAKYRTHVVEFQKVLTVESQRFPWKRKISLIKKMYSVKNYISYRTLFNFFHFFFSTKEK